MHSIRLKITAITIVAMLISFLALGVIGIRTVRVETDRSSLEKMNLISQNCKGALEDSLDSLKQSVDMAIYIADDSLEGVDFSSLGDGDLTPDAQARLDDILTEHCAAVQQAFGSIADNTKGIETYYYCINSDLGSNQHGFFFSKVGRDDFEEQPPLISTDLDPNDIEHTMWYYSPIERGEAIWIGPYKAHYLGELWTVSYVTPIYKDGTLIGVLGMDILFDTMIEQISSLRVYDTGFACLLDSDGRVLYHPRLEIGELPESVNDAIGLDVFNQDSNGDALLRYTVSGQERQFSFSTLSNGMKLLVIAPVEEITSSSRRLTRMIVVVSTVILAVFAALTMLAMNAVTKPLQHLTAASRRLAQGDYDEVLDYDGDDEVGTLTKSFRQMRDQMRAYIDDLNSRAYVDPLTGIKNKYAFDGFAEQENAAMRASDIEAQVPFALVIFDCNRIKQVNAEYGHSYGDIYLKTACRLICRIYAHSPVFRVGGDEFVAILKDSDYENRDVLLDDFKRTMRTISEDASMPWERADLSWGMATYRPGEDADLAAVLSRAEARMNAQKSAGSAQGA